MRSTNVRLPCVPLHQAGVATQALLTLYCLGPLPGYEDEQLLTGRTDDEYARSSQPLEKDSSQTIPAEVERPPSLMNSAHDDNFCWQILRCRVRVSQSLLENLFSKYQPFMSVMPGLDSLLCLYRDNED